MYKKLIDHIEKLKIQKLHYTLGESSETAFYILPKYYLCFYRFSLSDRSIQNHNHPNRKSAEGGEICYISILRLKIMRSDRIGDLKSIVFYFFRSLNWAQSSTIGPEWISECLIIFFKVGPLGHFKEILGLCWVARAHGANPA